jgi:hypothetical protein
MTWSEALLGGAAILSALAAIGSLFYKRRQPELDEATIEHTLVNSDAVKTEIERESRKLNADRDLRVIDLEVWADKMRPALYAVKRRDDVLCDLIRTAYDKLALPVPVIPAFPEIPEFPPPRHL